MNASNLISIILPVHKQADYIQKIVDTYLELLELLGWDFEILLIVNGNTPRTLDVCQTMAGSNPRIRSIYTDEAGWGRAIRKGLTEARGDILCYTNSARTSAHVLIPCIMLAVIHPQSAIKATRCERCSLFRRVISFIFNWFCRTLFGLKYSDVNGTPKVFHRDRFPFRSLEENGEMIDLEFGILCAKHSVPIIEVPIASRERYGGKSTTTWKTAIRMCSGLWRMSALRSDASGNGRIHDHE